jgi:hypothetical protein
MRKFTRRKFIDINPEKKYKTINIINWKIIKNNDSSILAVKDLTVFLLIRFSISFKIKIRTFFNYLADVFPLSNFQ